MKLRSMKKITCIEDLREMARRKVPRAFFDPGRPSPCAPV
jgi:hypothetical protein